MPLAAVIFDFDGVVADSEPVANRVLADLLTRSGAPTTLAESYATYVGKQAPEIVGVAEALHGVTLPADFLDRLQAETFARFRTDLRAVPGAETFIGRLGPLLKAIASSSSPARLALCLDTLGLADAFGAHVYSAQAVPRGKPHPDIYLHAAARLGVPPDACLVIEDSPSGVRAGVAAGMRVIGLLAGGHIQPDHAPRLEAAGAWRVARTYTEAAEMLGGLND